MRKLILTILLTLICTSMNHAREISKAGVIFNQVKDSVVTVMTAGHGSGFLIDDQGLVLTNHHVISNAKTVKVRFGNGQTREAKVLAKDSKYDLAVLWVNLKGIQQYHVLPLSQHQPIALVGEKILAIGSPIRWDVYERTLTAGNVSKYANDLITFDASINKGNSGGPLINMDGEAIGVNTIVDSAAGQALASAVAINKSTAVIAEARSAMQHTNAPSSKAKVSYTKAKFPIEKIDTSNLKKAPKPGRYDFISKHYYIKVTTPALIYREIAKVEQRNMKAREKRAAKKGFKVSDDEYITRNISDREKETIFKPVLTIDVLPQINMGGRSTERYFDKMDLIDTDTGKVVCEPLVSGRIDVTAKYSGRFFSGWTGRDIFQDVAYGGSSEYEPKCINNNHNLAIRIFSEGESQPEIKKLKANFHQVLKDDFRPVL